MAGRGTGMAQAGADMTRSKSTGTLTSLEKTSPSATSLRASTQAMRAAADDSKLPPRTTMTSSQRESTTASSAAEAQTNSAAVAAATAPASAAPPASMTDKGKRKVESGPPEKPSSSFQPNRDFFLFSQDGETETETQAIDVVGDYDYDKLDLTSEDIDFEEMDELVETFKDDVRIREALMEGVDLREYASRVEKDLKQAEKESVFDYIKESANLAALHKQIQTCDSILERMEIMLSGFQSDLGNISSEIKYLQEKSSTLSIKLRNRKNVNDKIAEFIRDITISSDLVAHICDGEVNEEYVEYLKVLDRKLAFTEAQRTKHNALTATADVLPELDRLKYRAVTKLREFLLTKIYALRKPKTNIGMQQQALLHYKDFNRFIVSHEKVAAKEIRDSYVDTMSKIYLNDFKNYLSNLGKLQLEPARRSDVLGAPDEGSSRGFLGAVGLGGGRTAGPRTNVFSLGNRDAVLDALNTPTIVPHEAANQKGAAERFPFEALFRSVHQTLVDTASAEYEFDTEFFGPDEGPTAIFPAVFGRTLSTLVEHYTRFADGCYDAVGLLLLIRIGQRFRALMAKRRVLALDGYFDDLLRVLWPRWKAVVELNIESLKTAAVAATHATLPHYITRRYAEFVTAIAVLCVPSAAAIDNTPVPAAQLRSEMELIGPLLAALRAAMEALLRKLKATLTNQRSQSILLINNYDLITTTLAERHIGVAGEPNSPGVDDYHYFKAALDREVAAFVEAELSSYFAALLQFVVSSEAYVKANPSATEYKVSTDMVLGLVKEFAQSWQVAVNKLAANTMTPFPNFALAKDILKQTFHKLVDYYERFCEIVKRFFKPLARELVPPTSLKYEISQAASSYYEDDKPAS